MIAEVQVWTIKMRITNLHCHRNLGGLVEDLLDGSIIALAQLLVQLQLIHVDRE